MFLDYLETEDSRYFVLFQNPILVKMSISTGTVEKYRILNGMDAQTGQFIKIFYYEGKILLIPLHHDDFVIYDEIKDEIRMIDIPQKGISRFPYGYFSMAVQKGQYVYAFGINYPGVVRIDIEDEQAQCICELKNWGIAGRGFTGEMIAYSGKAYLPIERDTKLALFDAESENLKIVETGIDGERFIKTICKAGEVFILIMNDGTSFVFDQSRSTASRISDLEELLKDRAPICHGANLDDDIFLFPERGNEVLIYSYAKHAGRWVSTPFENGDFLCFYYVKSENGILTFYNEQTNMLYSYNVEKGCFEKSSLQLSGGNYLKIMAKEAKVVKENERATLNLYIEGIYNS